MLAAVLRQQFRKSTWIAADYADRWRGMPTGGGADGAGEIVAERLVGFDAVFKMDRANFEYAIATMGLGIEASNQLATPKDGEAEISIAALGSRRVALEPIFKTEHHAGTLAIPDDRIER